MSVDDRLVDEMWKWNQIYEMIFPFQKNCYKKELLQLFQ